MQQSRDERNMQRGGCHFRAEGVKTLVAVVGVFWLTGCPASGGAGAGGTGGQRTGSAQTARQPKKICVVRVAEVTRGVRESEAYSGIRKKLMEMKKGLQKELDALIATYRQKFALDVKAAKYLEKEKKLEKKRGSVLSEAQYKQKQAELEAELQADPTFAAAVKEQREKTPEYKLRRQQALAEAKRITARGQQLQKALQQKANALSAPLMRKMEEAFRRGLTREIKDNGCTVLCDPQSGKILGHKGKRAQAEEVCRPNVEGADRTRALEAFVLESLGVSAPRNTSHAPTR
jgi:hypothetical protein